MKFQILAEKLLKFLSLFFVAIIMTVLVSGNLKAYDNNELLGGKTTVFNRTSSAYEQHSAGLNPEQIQRHRDGDMAFEAVFVTPPATVNAGLGPLFNNSSCAGCHIRNGRGLPKKGQILARVSQDKITSLTSPLNYHLEKSVYMDNTPPVPGLGTQIQDLGVYGYSPEAEVNINWLEIQESYGDGKPYSLRYPQAQITLKNGKPLSSDVQTSLRIPSPVFGVGLLEAIEEEDILALADEKDTNKDGISGKANRVWDEEKQSLALGRFGWKANQPNLLQQSASAYVNDMGVTNPLFPENDGSMDIDEQILTDATFYVQTLAVPARNLVNSAQVKKGEKLFAEANCIGCHVTTLKTGNYFVNAIAHQTIHPYSDLLLHDMGEGLADNRPDFQASGKEWRTTPLWGIGVTQTVLPYSGYLHDGRARTLEEAILWHGGEAQTSKEIFRNMAQDDRIALIRFLKSL
ncbi:di-heme oxidoredictase family protein [Cyanobacterium sp. DS4]|uniref:di-heme oxidoreductase family protein n=1 Tax=Cyanobacterium sp. DS4 TaxID=2878255 RepID=UPI002E800D2B|nr:di-heme oxidoredictase family protein [Cyanobacterium sp. Dongsha4]WVL02155.1 hypothetical protein Dongsha4_08190 [Cyanobacterium sp. Dongsha4]